MLRELRFYDELKNIFETSTVSEGYTGSYSVEVIVGVSHS